MFLLVAVLVSGCAVAPEIDTATDVEVEPSAAGPVAFVGDSITAFQDWEAAFPGLDLTNEGVASETAADILARIDPIVAAQPRAVFLLVGTNDLSYRVPTERTVAEVERILGRFAEGSRGTTVFLESVLPRQPEWTDAVRVLNRRLRPLAKRHGATWIDLWPTLAAVDGTLRAEYTDDGIHLSERGKQAWVEALRPHVEAPTG